MKYAANAVAPFPLCCFASAGITGGFSPGRTLGPLVSGPVRAAELGVDALVDGVGDGVTAGAGDE